MEKKRSLVVFTGLLAIACITVLWGQQLSVQQPGIRVWDWVNVMVLLAGLPFILVQTKAGLPELLGNNVPFKTRFAQPFLIGLFFGALDVLIIKVIMHPQAYDVLPPFLQPFPYSIFLYSSGALEIEIFYRLIPITLLLLADKWIWKGKYTNAVFWIAAIITSIREPLEQWPSGALWFIIYAAVSGFLMNLLQAVYFRKAGFLASLTLRLGHYFFWHILLGIYVQYGELAK